MIITEEFRQHLATFSNLFGQLFYYPLTHQHNQPLLAALQADSAFDNSELSPFIETLAHREESALNQDFLTLFEGAGVMPAPPWGSVYLDKEQVIFGDSLLRYREFLNQAEVGLNTGMREPEDQFGLMLMALAQLIAQQATAAQIRCYFEQHLLPWAMRYLSLMQQSAMTESYQQLARVTQAWLSQVKTELALTPEPLKLYR